MDLKFPHHECEIAQAVGANDQKPVNYWIHSNMLTVNGQKMSKSLGNSFLPRELFAGDHALLDRGYGAMTVRFFMLQSHYSSPLDFSNDALGAAEKGYKKIINALAALNALVHEQKEVDDSIEKDLLRLIEECYKNMSDDFNTAKTLAVLFEMAARINDFKSGNTQLSKVSKDVFDQFKTTYQSFVKDVLGLREENEQNNDLLDGTIQILIELRKKARLDKNFALSDKIRDDLKALGVQLKDGKDGAIDYEIEP